MPNDDDGNAPCSREPGSAQPDAVQPDSVQPDSGRPEAPRADTEALTRLLTTLADDPDAPPSAVTAESVLAAARAQRPVRNGLNAVPGTGRRQSTRPAAPRRRTGLIALVAAASLAGIAAIVVPLTVGAGNSTNTASDSASTSILAASANAGSAAAGIANAGSAAAGGAAAQSFSAGDQSAAANAGGAAPGSAAAGESAAAPGPAGVSAAAAAAGAQPSNGDQAEAAGPAGAAAGQACWPPLSAAAAAALTDALPAGAFAAPVSLDGGCEQDPVAGAVLPGAVPGTELVVRVVKAEPGACARSAGEAGSRCVASGNGRYTAADPSGGQTVIVYGNGKEVSAGSLTSVDGVPSVPTGLSADQLETAARAVLAALP